MKLKFWGAKIIELLRREMTELLEKREVTEEMILVVWAEMYEIC